LTVDKETLRDDGAAKHATIEWMLSPEGTLHITGSESRVPTQSSAPYDIQYMVNHLRVLHDQLGVGSDK
jgi:hypothetical protein